MTRQLLSKIPAINKILLLDEIQDLIESYNEVAVKSAIKSHIEEVKQGILNEELTEVPSLEIIVSEVSKKVEKEDKKYLSFERKEIYYTVKLEKKEKFIEDAKIYLELNGRKRSNIEKLRKILKGE